MAKSLLPLRTIETLRQHMDVVLQIYGFECQLYIVKPSVIKQRKELAVYNERPDLDEKSFEDSLTTRVFVEWSPDIKRLRNLGMFTEGVTPIIAWFKGIENLARNSYIKIDINYVNGDYRTDEFELVDRIIRNMYNAVAIECWHLAPRRR